MGVISMHEAKSTLSQLVKRAVAGETIFSLLMAFKPKSYQPTLVLTESSLLTLWQH